MQFDDSLRFYRLPEIVEVSRDLARRVNSKYRPDIVIGVLNDGFVPSFEIAQELKVPYGFIKVQRPAMKVFYDDGERIIEGGVVVPGQSDCALKGKRVLLADDTYHIGRTLEFGKAYLKSNGARWIRTAVLNLSRSGRTQRNKIQKPDFWEFEGYSGVFPWDAHWLEDDPERCEGYAREKRALFQYLMEKEASFPELEPVTRSVFQSKRRA